MPPNVDLLDDRATVVDANWILWVKRSAVYDPETVGLVRFAHQQGGMRDDMTTLIMNCCDYVVRLLRVGGWCKVRGGGDDLEYCID